MGEVLLALAAAGAFILWKKNAAGGGSAAAQQAAMFDAGVQASAIVNQQTALALQQQQAAGAQAAKQAIASSGPDLGVKVASTALKTGGAIASMVPGVGTIVGGAMSVAGGLVDFFGSVFGGGPPPDPAQTVLITAMPYEYQGQDNLPARWLGGGARDKPIYALDAFGYLYPLAPGAQIAEKYRPRDANGTGFLFREVIAVNLVAFAILPRRDTEITYRENVTLAPRPTSADEIRGTFGNDCRFKLDRSDGPHGPWEGGAVAPIAGSPAALAEGARYAPTHTDSPGEF